MALTGRQQGVNMVVNRALTGLTLVVSALQMHASSVFLFLRGQSPVLWGLLRAHFSESLEISHTYFGLCGGVHA